MTVLASLLFKPGSPKEPTTKVETPPPAPPPPPAPAPPAALEAEASAGAGTEQQAVKKRRGQAATIYTSPLGATPSAQQPRALLGG